MSDKPFKVRDFRNKHFFMLDDVYLNGYAKILGAHASCVYFSLCRHANKEQSAFPSEDLIAKEFDMSVRTVRSKIKLLKDANLIRVERERSTNGKWMRNTYYLLDKSEWKSPEAIVAYGNPEANNDKNQVSSVAHGSPQNHRQQLHTKETYTHKKGTQGNSKRIEKLKKEIRKNLRTI